MLSIENDAGGRVKQTAWSCQQQSNKDNLGSLWLVHWKILLLCENRCIWCIQYSTSLLVFVISIQWDVPLDRTSPRWTTIHLKQKHPSFCEAFDIPVPIRNMQNKTSFALSWWIVSATPDRGNSHGLTRLYEQGFRRRTPEFKFRELRKALHSKFKKLRIVHCHKDASCFYGFL